MGLRDLVEAASSTEGSLKNIIKLRLIEDRVVPTLTPDGYMRVSSLASMCPREEVLAARTPTEPRRDVVDADLSLIFAHGKGLHYALQNEVLPGIGVLLGIWRCVECAKQYGTLTEPLASSQTLVRRPKACECGNADFLYREQHFVNKEYQIGGHPDGFITLPGFPGLGIVECKSINSRRAWEVRQTPDMAHVIQTQCYMWLTNLKWGKILYWDKGGMGSSSLIEHTVEYDEETVSLIKLTLKSLWAGLKEDGPLPTKICTTQDCPRASKCSLAELCFSEGL